MPNQRKNRTSRPRPTRATLKVYRPRLLPLPTQANPPRFINMNIIKFEPINNIPPPPEYSGGGGNSPPSSRAYFEGSPKYKTPKGY